MGVFKKILVFLGTCVGAIANSHSEPLNPYEGCSGELDCEKLKYERHPLAISSLEKTYQNLTEVELLELQNELYTLYDQYKNTHDFQTRFGMLGEIRKTIHVLHAYDFVDSDVILLASEVDTKVCQHGK